LAVLRNQSFDIALVDMRLKADERGNTDGLDVAQFIRDMGYSTQIILKSGFPTETSEIEKKLEILKLFAVLDKAAEGQVRQLSETVAQAAAKQMASS
jgi:ActR/RegA family two-component response regulator